MEKNRKTELEMKRKTVITFLSAARFALSPLRSLAFLQSLGRPASPGGVIRTTLVSTPEPLHCMVCLASASRIFFNVSTLLYI